VAARQALDHQPRPGVRPKKRNRDRLIRLAQRRPDWALGFGDEGWRSRLARPSLHTWAEADRPLRLHELALATDDPDPKALACYGLLARWAGPDGARQERMWLRFVDGRPVSAVTTQFLAWCCARVAAAGKRALLLVWDNASWHVNAHVRAWIRAHNRRVKRDGRGVRILACYLPIKSPWLNPIEPKWVHGKRRIVEPDRLLTALELAERVCAAFRCPHEDHLTMTEKVV
jgi:transposase